MGILSGHSSHYSQFCVFEKMSIDVVKFAKISDMIQMTFFGIDLVST